MLVRQPLELPFPQSSGRAISAGTRSSGPQPGLHGTSLHDPVTLFAPQLGADIYAYGFSPQPQLAWQMSGVMGF